MTSFKCVFYWLYLNVGEFGKLSKLFLKGFFVDAIVCIWKRSQLEAQHIFGEVEKNQENWSTVRTLRLVESSLPIINQVRHSSLGNDHILCVSLTFNLFDLLRSPERTSRLGIHMSMFFLSNQNSDHHWYIITFFTLEMKQISSWCLAIIIEWSHHHNCIIRFTMQSWCFISILICL